MAQKMLGALTSQIVRERSIAENPTRQILALSLLCNMVWICCTHNAGHFLLQELGWA